MKEVYLAIDKSNGGQVALALLVPDGRDDVTMAARFSREGKAASVLRSPHTVRVHDVGKLADGSRFMVTEAVIGRGLDEAMSHGAIAPELAARFAVHVLAALEEAHRRGILHRDVKPENVLLLPSDDGEIAKLTDFGLAKVLDVALEGSQQLRTAQNIVLGTPDYMPPEQWQGSVQDARTDLYAVGVMLFEMLAGKTPFESKFLHALCIAHCTQPPPPLPAGLPTLAYRLEPIVRRALQKHPVDRFSDAAAMRTAIEQVSGARPVDGTAGGSARSSVPAGGYARAELLCDEWPGTVSIVASRDVVIGRDPGAHVVARCLPVSEDNVMRMRSISREHTRVGWRDGALVVTDLDSRSGTFVDDRQLRANESAPIAFGAIVGVGKHVRFRVDHGALDEGGTPAWVRLTRVDPYGGGLVHLQVLRDAEISARAVAALRVDTRVAGDESVRIVIRDGGLAFARNDDDSAVHFLRDGDSIPLGTTTLSVAVE